MRLNRVLPLILSLALLLSFFAPHVEARKKKKTVTDQFLSAIDTALIQEPKDQEVCFSPEERCDIKLQKFVQSAKKSIDVAAFDINLDQLVHQLLVASKKMPVRIVVDARQAKGAYSLAPLLIKAGAQIRLGRQRGLMHHKFTLVDGKMLQTGSFNYTNHASKANHENQIYLSNPTVIKRYQQHFEGLWENARSPNSIRDASLR